MYLFKTICFKTFKPINIQNTNKTLKFGTTNVFIDASHNPIKHFAIQEHTQCITCTFGLLLGQLNGVTFFASGNITRCHGLGNRFKIQLNQGTCHFQSIRIVNGARIALVMKCKCHITNVQHGGNDTHNHLLFLFCYSNGAHGMLGFFKRFRVTHIFNFVAAALIDIVELVNANVQSKFFAFLFRASRHQLVKNVIITFALCLPHDARLF